MAAFHIFIKFINQYEGLGETKDFLIFQIKMIEKALTKTKKFIAEKSKIQCLSVTKQNHQVSHLFATIIGFF